jgi:hypothetical protein
VEVQPHDIGDLFREFRITGKLERADLMRFKPAAAIYRPEVDKGSLLSRELARAADARLKELDPQIVDPRVRVAEWACEVDVIAVR